MFSWEMISIIILGCGTGLSSTPNNQSIHLLLYKYSFLKAVLQIKKKHIIIRRNITHVVFQVAYKLSDYFISQGR